jgi:SnoaL-like protein
VLRLAGVFTQLACAICLLLGTIAFVLVQQNGTGGAGLAIGWAAVAMVGLVLGGLMARGGLIAVIGSALVDGAFGVALLVMEYDDLRALLRVLPVSDVDTIAEVLTGAGGGMIATAIVCLVAIPQALRYTRWLSSDAGLELMAASSTARGFPPPPISAMRGSMWHVPAAAHERRSYRRLYFALAGFAIGFGAGIGVLVSSTTRSRGGGSSEVTSDAGAGSAVASNGSNGSNSAKVRTSGSGTNTSGSAATGSADSNAIASTGSNRAPVDAGVPNAQHDAGTSSPPTVAAAKIESVGALLAAERAALAKGDPKQLIALLAPHAFAFGVDADEVMEGRDAIEAQLDHDLGDMTGGAAVEAKYTHIGQLRDHAWIAQDLDITTRGHGRRRFAVTQLAAQIDGNWTVVAWNWGIQVPDGAAENMLVLGTKPKLKPVVDAIDGPRDLDTAVRGAFASRDAFVDARSERDDAFNYGSAPGERIIGGNRVKQIFGGLRAQIRLRDNVRAAAANAWDPKQKDPAVAFAAVNVEYSFHGRAATELTQTFRVLAVLVKEGTTWRIVQTQWSHGGPIR